MEQLLTYAYNADKKLVSIEDVLSGLDCNCYCPSCNGRLIARKGSVKVHHFAHYQCPECATGYQTSIHLLAKEIISERKYFYLDHFGNELKIKPSKILLEKKTGDIIPDILIYCGSRLLIIEIYVTHKVDVYKLDKIRKMKTSAIEIDLHDLVGNINKENLWTEINKPERQKWLYNDKDEARIENKAKYVTVN